ncbi:hypothetical protein H5V43_20125 [Sphingobium fuliginis]|jgi:hypothetical protein|uniref:Uncharacterized protein n=3 Tax=Sphingomonadaceae TaxID=41297 RepID=A0A7M2GLB0_SPHSA|nr:MULTISPECIES: hypothetical protein [Sphingobium]AJR23929.1 hypothetical protein TZ53_09540 [Sphingobium sp. YBL2]QDC40077.1 hypothetical protein FIL70_23540 [Sphingobium fuliginis ATCC 27551]QOT73521.1 hypothetical protein H5V43_20125 [Sphingobium fuliginis]UXC92847.1 hypothetical protein EGM87_21315 [Sphingobium sp. RSMS]
MMSAKGDLLAKAPAGDAPDRTAADALPWFQGADSVPTHFGMVGLLQEKGMVVDLGAPQPGGTRPIHYRRSSGALLSISVPLSMAVAAGDFLLVKSLTCPDGAVRPVAVRPPASPDWIAIADLEGILRHYGAGASRFVRWSAGAGAACGIAALCGVAAPVTALAGMVAGVAAFGLHRRDRRDRGRVRRLIG